MAQMVMAAGPAPAGICGWKTEYERAYRLRALVVRPSAGARPVARQTASPGMELVLRVMEQITTWYWRTKSRRALLGLSDDLLNDVGIGRIDAWGESRKPFWQA